MTAVFSATWHGLRLGLEACPSGRAAFSAQRMTFSSSRQYRQPLQQLRTLQRSCYCNHSPISSNRDRRPTTAIRSVIFPPRKQSRWASLWKDPTKPREEEEESVYEINVDEIKRIFGKNMNPQKGAEVLMAIQTGRMEGTLDQIERYPDNWTTRGLAYLRAKFPMDEDAAIIARIDREIGNGPTPTSVSQFEKLRHENKQKAIERQKREVEEQESLETKGNQTPKGLQARTTPGNAVLGQRQRSPEPVWRRKYREKVEKLELPPDVTTMQRLLPSGIVVITVVALSLLFAKYYTPPSKKARLFPDLPPAAATVLTIIAANVFVIFMWRIPPLWPFMNTAFIVFPTCPSAKSMLGASFSHHQFTHLLVNMSGLWWLGTRVHDDIGRGPFLALYFASAVLGAYIPMAAYVLTNNLGTGTVGASACLFALLGTSCILHEGRTIHIGGVPEIITQGIDTGAFLALAMGMEIFGLRRSGLSSPRTPANAPAVLRSDHMGHLTGGIVGIIAGMMVRWKDPKWRDIRREHWYSSIFGKDAEEPPDP